MQKSVMIRVIFSLILLVITAGCEKSAAPSGASTPVAASNSFLECAAQDVLGDSAPVLRLAQPGMCPGHFDIRPSQVQQLRHCRLLLRMDFQQPMDAKLAGVIDAGLKVVPVHIEGGLCEPNSYLSACRQIAEALVDAGLLTKEKEAERLRRIESRIRELIRQCQKEVISLQNTPVLCSVHQEAFCRWLGLDVVATFRGADVESTRQLNEAMKIAREKGVRLIVANRPEGSRCTDFLAERLGAKAAMFDNFPAMENGQNSFDDMVRGNIAELIKAADKK